MFSRPHWPWLAVALAAFLLAATSTPAAVSEVTDHAGLFAPESIKRAAAILQDIKRDHNQDVVIETYPGIPADRQAAWEAEKNDPEKRTHFFAEWGRERFRTLNVNGIYLLITKDPSHFQMDVGNVTVALAFTMENRDRLDEIVVARLRKRDYDGGLLAGVEYVRQAMGENLAGARAEAAPSAVPGAEHASWFRGMGLLGWWCIGLMVLAVLAVGLLVIHALRGRAARRSAGPGVSGPVPGLWRPRLPG